MELGDKMISFRDCDGNSKNISLESLKEIFPKALFDFFWKMIEKEDIVLYNNYKEIATISFKDSRVPTSELEINKKREKVYMNIWK